MQQVRLELDSNVRRSSNGTALMGGSPFRLIRLSAAGSQLLNDWLTGTATLASSEATKLRDRLIRGGMVHPVFSPVPTNSPEVTSAFVVPVHNDSDGLDRLLGVLRSYSPDSQVVVVDDASADVSSVAAIVAAHGADFSPSRRQPRAGGSPQHRLAKRAPTKSYLPRGRNFST